MRRVWVVVGVGAVLVGVAGGWLWFRRDDLASLLDGGRLRHWLGGMGAWGPFAIALLRALAVLIAVLPNSPITAAAGAAYGEIWGTVYVMAGAEIGAMLAFLIARSLGYDRVRRWPWLKGFRRARIVRWLLDPNQSQPKLLGALFVVRAVPFLNMDVVSYAAGLTRLSIWPYALVTFVGMLPFNLLVVFLGDHLVSGEGHRTLAWVALGGLAAMPFAVKLVWNWWRARTRAT